MDQAWRRAAVVALLLLVAAGALIAAADTGGFTGWDRAVLAAVVESRTPSLNAGMIVLTEVGNTAASTVLAVVVGGVLLWRGRRAEGLYVAATTVTASGVFTVIKQLLDRPRPPAQLQVIRETNESLPSGHATMSAAVFTSILVVFWPVLAARGRALLTLVAVLWVGAVGTSRIYLGVHWFSDVLSGWALGLAWALVGATLLLWWRARAPVTADA